MGSERVLRDSITPIKHLLLERANEDDTLDFPLHAF